MRSVILAIFTPRPTILPTGRRPPGRGLRIVAIALVAALAMDAGAGAGKKMHKKFVAENQFYADEKWQQYVRDIGARLLEQTPDRGREYHFHVLDGDQVNAFATADAYIFVSRGLLAFISSEDQLAAVIGHEIGHVVGRHMRKRRITELAGKSVGIFAAILTGRGEMMSLSNPLTSLVVSGYGREMELEADRLGGEFLARAGYDPQAIIATVWVLKDQQIFSKKVSQKPMNYHGVFASHPKNDKRLHDAVGHARGMTPDVVGEPVGDFWAMVDGLAFGDAAARGLIKDETFYHRGLRIVVRFPDQWMVAMPQSHVEGRPPGGTAEGFITFARHEYKKRKSPAEYVTKVLKRDDVTAGEELEINDMDAYIGEIDTSQSSVQLQLIAVLYRGRDVFLFKGECGPQGNPERFREQFRATIESLRPITTADVRLVNKHRINVIVAEPGQTYADLARQSSLREYPEETLRLLNADYPNGEPRPGDFIKIVK